MNITEFQKQIHTIETSDLETLCRELGTRSCLTNDVRIQIGFSRVSEIVANELPRRLKLNPLDALLCLDDEDLLKALSD